jgi:hypothetical protein
MMYQEYNEPLSVPKLFNILGHGNYFLLLMNGIVVVFLFIQLGH